MTWKTNKTTHTARNNKPAIKITQERDSDRYLGSQAHRVELGFKGFKKDQQDQGQSDLQSDDI